MVDLTYVLAGILVGMVVCIFALLLVSSYYFCVHASTTARVAGNSSTAVYAQDPVYMTNVQSSQPLFSQGPVMTGEAPRRIFLPDQQIPQMTTGYGCTMP
jgi:hypothetical protein